jgi:hypothetical protein
MIHIGRLYCDEIAPGDWLRYGRKGSGKRAGRWFRSWRTTKIGLGGVGQQTPVPTGQRRAVSKP